MRKTGKRPSSTEIPRLCFSFAERFCYASFSAEGERKFPRSDPQSGNGIGRPHEDPWPLSSEPRIRASAHRKAAQRQGAGGRLHLERARAPLHSSPFTRRLGLPLIADLTRKLGNGLLPRLAAQLVELAVLQLRLRTGLTRLDEAAEPIAGDMPGGVGIAQVQAARGLLVHRVAVDRGRICDYRILAPTEWNFHPQGVVARGLSALPPTDAATLKRLARLFVTAVDPCVAYHVTVY